MSATSFGPVWVCWNTVLFLKFSKCNTCVVRLTWIDVNITTAIAGTHPFVGKVTEITAFKTESRICIKWRPPSGVSCGSAYNYIVQYKFDFHDDYIVVTESELVLTNLNPDTHVNFFITAVCTCPSRVFGKGAKLSLYTCKLHMYVCRHCAYMYMHTYTYACMHVWIYIHTFILYIHICIQSYMYSTCISAYKTQPHPCRHPWNMDIHCNADSVCHICYWY